jgi:hypothetical protein
MRAFVQSGGGEGTGFGEFVKAVYLQVRYEDGSVMHASGEDARIIWEYLESCQQFCSLHGWCYSGPTLQKLDLSRVEKVVECPCS